MAEEADTTAEANLTDEKRAEIQELAANPDNLLGPEPGILYAVTFTDEEDK